MGRPPSSHEDGEDKGKVAHMPAGAPGRGKRDRPPGNQGSYKDEQGTDAPLIEGTVQTNRGQTYL